VIVEGVNVLQTPARRGRADPTVVVSDFFDFSVYVDAGERDLERWYVERLLLLRETSLHDPRSFFHFLTGQTPEATADFARQVWTSVNLVNLHENIAPTRGRAHLILEKDGEHAVQRVRLRKV
jgi:type I pantothenate kinase